MIAQLQSQFRSNHPRKEYIALVEGKFPETQPADGLVYSHTIESYKLNSTRIKSHIEAKECQTVFHKIKEYQIANADGTAHYTLLRCIPLQGRTHQIRIHLVLLGYPIVNDYLYNKRDELSRYTPNINDVQTAVNKMVTRYSFDNRHDTGFPLLCDISTNRDDIPDNSAWSTNITKKIGRNVPYCLECELGGYVQQGSDSKLDPMFMCLHSWKYHIDSMKICFEAKWPKWATDTSYTEEMLIEREKRIKTCLNEI